jgi:hypothetical protein
MYESDFKINPSCHINRVFVGNKRTPVVIIDDFIEDLSTLKDFAKNYVEMKVDDSNYYPGIRAELPMAYAKNVVAVLFKQLYKLYNIPQDKEMRAVNLVYSLITKSPDELALHQKRPHFDTPAPYHFAILHYLNPGNYGPTGFFRHKRTGLERINIDEMDSYLTLVGKTITNANVGYGYIQGTTEEYELIYQVPYKYNRVVIYPGNLLHTALVQENSDIDSNATTGRLTANIFIEYV